MPLRGKQPPSTVAAQGRKSKCNVYPNCEVYKYVAVSIQKQQIPYQQHPKVDDIELFPISQLQGLTHFGGRACVIARVLSALQGPAGIVTHHHATILCCVFLGPRQLGNINHGAAFLLSKTTLACSLSSQRVFGCEMGVTRLRGSLIGEPRYSATGFPAPWLSLH